MKIDMFLTENKRGLQVTVTLPKRHMASEPILTKSKREIVSLVKEEYPEFVLISGPRKVSNNTDQNLMATWAFEMTEPAPAPKKKPAPKKTTTRKRKAPLAENKTWQINLAMLYF